LTDELGNNIIVAAKKFAKRILDAEGYYSDSKIIDQYSNVGFDKPEDVRLAASNLNSLLFGDFERIAGLTTDRVLKYVKTFDVDATKIDFYKVAYFYAMVSLEFIKNENPSYRLLASVALVYLMDEILEEDIGTELETHMKTKLLRSMSVIPDEKSGAYPWLRLFGQYGVYMIYKCVFKHHKPIEEQE